VPTMTSTEDKVGVLEASRMSGIPGDELYMMIFQGELEAMPTLEHGVLVPLEAVRRLMRERAAAAGQD
jgi:hypothetical protein